MILVGKVSHGGELVRTVNESGAGHDHPELKDCHGPSFRFTKGTIYWHAQPRTNVHERAVEKYLIANGSVNLEASGFAWKHVTISGDNWRKLYDEAHGF